MNDYISRQAAIDALHDEIVKRRISEDTNDDGALDEFDTEAILRRLPSIQPERKRGHWIEVDDDLIRGKCSVCGWESHLYEDDVVGMDYCPNCGARLEDADATPN